MEPKAKFTHSSVIKTVLLIAETQIVTGDQEGIVALWNITTGENLFYEKEHLAQIMALEFHEEKQVIISASADETIVIWDFPSGDIIKVLENHTNWVRGLHISQNRNELVSCSYDNSIIQWKFTGKRYPIYKATLIGHTYFVTICKFSCNDSLIVSSSFDGSVKLWDSNDSSCKATLIHSKESRINHMAISDDERWIATAGEDGNIIAWSIETKKRQFVVSHRESIRFVAFNLHSTELICASEDKTMSICKVQSGKMIKQIFGHSDQINQCIIHPLQTGYIIISASNDKTIKLWTCTGTLLQTHHNSCPVIVMTKRQNFLASASMDRSVVVWKITNE